MMRRFSINFGILAFLFDCILISFSLYTANLIRPFLNQLPFVAYLPEPVIPLVLYPVFSVFWAAILLFFAVYDGRKNKPFIQDWINLTSGSVFAGIGLAGILYLSFRDISRVLFVVFFLQAYIYLLSWRIIHLYVQQRSPNKPSLPRILVIGANNIGHEIREKIQNMPELSLEFAGFLDDLDNDTSVLGSLNSARRVILENSIDEVVIALPESDHQKVAEIVSDLHTLPLRLWVIPNYFQLALFRAGIEDLAGIPMLDLHAPAISEYQRVVKRVLDLVLCVAVLIPGIPIMALTALAVWLDSGRPILFRQIRVGENTKPFTILKFRTMMPEAEKIHLTTAAESADTPSVHKIINDPRVTRVGRVLRRFSLDELPQFFNVLLGEMSLVGPRPELPEIVERYEPWQRQRFTVPPGITGWWQISGRSEKLMHLHTEDDVYYIKNYSFFLDLQIIFKTVWVVLSGRGAW